MSKDGTLPEGTEHYHVDRAFSGVESEDVCEACLADLTGDGVEAGMCDYCAAVRYRTLYRDAKHELNQLRREGCTSTLKRRRSTKPEGSPIKDAIHLTCAAFLSILLVIVTLPCLPFVWLWSVVVNNEE